MSSDTINRKIAVGVVGASGRMGRMLIETILDNAQTHLVGAYDRPDSLRIGMDVGELIGRAPCGIKLSALGEQNAPMQDIAPMDVLIDFSLPCAFCQTIKFCQMHKVALVMGVTGLSKDNEKQLQALSEHIPIVYAGNYSTGVNLSLNLLATTAKTLGLPADVEIIETHHKHKLDAPSGTALMMAQAVCGARNQSMDAVIYGRSGNHQRQVGEVAIHALRGGEIVGEHSVKFIMDGEVIEITHKAALRNTFANGAVRAGIWLADKPCGLYDMQDVLGLKMDMCL